MIIMMACTLSSKLVFLHSDKSAVGFTWAPCNSAVKVSYMPHAGQPYSVLSDDVASIPRLQVLFFLLRFNKDCTGPPWGSFSSQCASTSSIGVYMTMNKPNKLVKEWYNNAYYANEHPFHHDWRATAIGANVCLYALPADRGLCRH